LPLLARLSGTLCPRTCGIRMFLRTVTGSHWRRLYFRSTSVFSALEVFCENVLYKFTFDIDKMTLTLLPVFYSYYSCYYCVRWSGASLDCGLTTICGMAEHRLVRRLKTTSSPHRKTSWSDTSKCGLLKHSHWRVDWHFTNSNATLKFAQTSNVTYCLLLSVLLLIFVIDDDAVFLTTVDACTFDELWYIWYCTSKCLLCIAHYIYICMYIH